jgi:hypothetical protein
VYEEVQMKKTEKLIKWNRIMQSILFGVLIILTSCAPVAQNPNLAGGTSVDLTSTPATPVSREAQVQSVEAQITNTAPVQVNAVVRGNLTESCAVLGETQVEYAANAFQITVYSLSLADRDCAQATMPFETTIPLNSKDLPAGTYTVIANGVSAVFTLPGEDPTPSPEPIATLTLASASQACVDSAAFVGDVTIPDNTIVASNTAFTKTWRLKNTGSCTWNNSYLVSYISGTTMGQQPGYWIVPQGQTVAPGQTVDVSVGMTSPTGNGNYQSYWGLKKEQGQFIPIQGGANGNSFYVKIKVQNDVTDGNITAASIDIEREDGSGAVCTADATYFVHAYITTDGPATISYEINSTAGQIAAGYFQSSPTGPVFPVVTGTLVFDRADIQSMDWRFVGPYPYPDDITVNLWVNGEKWQSTKLACQ